MLDEELALQEVNHPCGQPSPLLAGLSLAATRRSRSGAPRQNRWPWSFATALLLKIEKMPTVRRKRLYEINRD